MIRIAAQPVCAGLSEHSRLRRCLTRLRLAHVQAILQCWAAEVAQGHEWTPARRFRNSRAPQRGVSSGMVPPPLPCGWQTWRWPQGDAASAETAKSQDRGLGGLKEPGECDIGAHPPGCGRGSHNMDGPRIGGLGLPVRGSGGGVERPYLDPDPWWGWRPASSGQSVCRRRDSPAG